MTDRLADKLQYKNQIYSDDDWILNLFHKTLLFVKRVKRRLKKLEDDLKTNFTFYQVSYKISVFYYIFGTINRPISMWHTVIWSGLKILKIATQSFCHFWQIKPRTNLLNNQKIGIEKILYDQKWFLFHLCRLTFAELGRWFWVIVT